MLHSEADEEFAAPVPAGTAKPVGSARKMPPLWVFFLFPMPVAVSVPLSFLLRREGVAVDAIANEVALLSVPQVLYFLWSPLADVGLRRRTWLLVSAAGTATATIVVFHMHSFAAPLAVLLLFLGQCVAEMTMSAAGGIKAEVVPLEERARVSSLHQMGNLGGGALCSGGLMMLVGRWSMSAVGWVSGAMIFLPSLASLRVNEPAPEPMQGNYARRLQEMWVEFKATFLRLEALPALLLLMSPLGCGAAIGLLPGIAQDYGLSNDQIAWLNGIAGGLLTAAGAMLALLVPKRADMRVVYVWVGIANALAIGILCVGPLKPINYLVGTVLYLLSAGAEWAVFTAVVLQLIGVAGKSGSTRYSIAVCLGNAPTAYMAAVDGLGAKWWGTRGLAGIDMGVSGVVAVGFLVWMWVTREARRMAVAGPETGVGAVG